MKNSQIISEVSRIREIMGIELSQSTPLNEGIIPRSALISAAAQALPSVLLKTTGKAALDAIDDVEKASIKTILKNVDNTLTDAVLDAKTGSELVSDLVEAGQKYASKFGVDGASALVRIMTKVDDFADEMVIKIANEPALTKQFQEIANRLPRNPKLYNKTLDALTTEYGSVIAKKILNAAQVFPAFGSKTTKFSLELLSSIETAMKSNAKLSKSYSKLSKNAEAMDAIYKKADEMFASGQTIKTADITSIIDNYAPEEIKSILKTSWLDGLQSIYKTETGEFRTKRVLALGLLIYTSLAMYLDDTAETKYSECIVRPNHPLVDEVGNKKVVTFTQEEITLGLSNSLPTESQRWFNILVRSCKEEKSDYNVEDFFNTATFGLSGYLVRQLSGKGSKEGESKGEVIQVGVDDKTPIQTKELTGAEILEKFKTEVSGKSEYWGPYKDGGVDYWGYTEDQGTKFVDYYYSYDKTSGKFTFVGPAVERPKE